MLTHGAKLTTSLEHAWYGAQANEHFRYYDPNIAEGITLTGQLVIRFISNRVNDFLNERFKTQVIDYIVANDTDSMYVTLDSLVNKVCAPDMDIQKKVTFVDKFSSTYIQPYLDSEFGRLADYLNCVDNKFSMKREVIADKAVWRGKKNYIMQVWDNEGVRYTEPDLKMMGVETARSSTPRLCKTALEACYNILINGTEQELIDYVTAFRLEFMSAPLDQIAFPRGVSDMDKWKDRTALWKTGTPIHVKAAIMYNEMVLKTGLQGTNAFIRNGDKIKFIYLKEPNHTHCHVIGFLDDIPQEFDLHDVIDRSLQYDKSFLFPLRSFSDLVNMNTEKRVVLDSFFSDDDAESFAAVRFVSLNKDEPCVVKRAAKPEVVEQREYVPVPKKAAPRNKVKPVLDSFFE